MSKYNRRGGAEVNMGYVEGVRKNYPPQFKPPRYLEFIERALAQGMKVILYMPKKGVSKYVTVIHSRKQFKVRFSNHRPIKHLEEVGACDFFVGVTNLKVTTTDQAWEAMLSYFEIKEN